MNPTKIDKDDILDLIGHSGWRSILLVVEELVVAEEANLLKLNLDGSGNPERELLIRKARAEGSRRLFEAFKRRLESYRPTKK